MKGEGGGGGERKKIKKPQKKRVKDKNKTAPKQARSLFAVPEQSLVSRLYVRVSFSFPQRKRRERGAALPAGRCGAGRGTPRGGTSSDPGPGWQNRQGSSPGAGDPARGPGIRRDPAGQGAGMPPGGGQGMRGGPAGRDAPGAGGVSGDAARGGQGCGPGAGEGRAAPRGRGAAAPGGVGCGGGAR